MTGRLWRPIGHRLVSLRWPLACLAASLIVLACMVVIPQGLVRWELGAQTDTLTAADRARALNDIRTTLLQGIGGAVLLLGAYFTYRQLQNGRDQLEVARQQAQATAEQAGEQLALAQQGQVTERFTRAVDQLGSPEVDIRIGGIYGLERIARDSAADRVAVVEVLAAFVRNHAPWPPKTQSGEPVDRLRRRMPDVQAAMTVLGRVHWRDSSVELELSDTDLRRVHLKDADFRGARLHDVHLESGLLTRVVLRHADLGNAHLQDASLRDVDLEGADLHDADLEGAKLDRVLLNGASFRIDEGKRGARLHGADLRNAQLASAELHGAKADASTIWPPGFDPAAAGVRLEEPAGGRQPGSGSELEGAQGRRERLTRPARRPPA